MVFSKMLPEVEPARQPTASGGFLILERTNLIQWITDVKDFAGLREETLPFVRLDPKRDLGCNNEILR